MDELSLTPSTWAFDHVDDVLIVAFAELDHDGWTLEIQREMAAGLPTSDAHCLVINGGATHYGAIEGWSVDPGMVRLEFTKAAQESLAVSRQMWLSLDALDVAEGEVVAALRRVLE